MTSFLREKKKSCSIVKNLFSTIQNRSLVKIFLQKAGLNPYNINEVGNCIIKK